MSNLNIFKASSYGDLERVKYLIGIEGDDINKKDNWVTHENI